MRVQVLYGIVWIGIWFGMLSIVTSAEVNELTSIVYEEHGLVLKSDGYVSLNANERLISLFLKLQIPRFPKFHEDCGKNINTENRQTCSEFTCVHFDICCHKKVDHTQQDFFNSLSEATNKKISKKLEEQVELFEGLVSSKVDYSRNKRLV